MAAPRRAKTSPAPKTAPPKDAEQPVPVKEPDTEGVMSLDDLLSTEEKATPAPKKTNRNVFIEIVGGSFMAFSKIWTEGQVISISPDVYDTQKDTDGDNWLDLRNDQKAQEAKYGRVVFKTARPDQESLAIPAV